MLDSHVLNVPPFYDHYGKILHPSQYRRYLEGALVVVQFTLAHYAIEKETVMRNVFSSDIHDILILYNGTGGQYLTPRKRRAWQVSATHPSSPSPTKRRKT